MYNITLISTVHKEIGKCNSDELYKIFESINPDVIFLEAFEENYSEYDKMLFSQFGVYKERLELKTIQTYSQNHTFEYVPVLDIGLSDEFETKIKIVSENNDCQRLLDNYTLLEMDGGFQFLNSKKSIVLQEEMREFENRIIDNETMRQKVNASIDAYENSMLRNIYSLCKEKSFNTAIFMCGAAHRKTIIEKIGEYEKKTEIKLNWTLYNDTF
ncbi:MAG: hypothetical protein AB7D46_05575 [Flavobacteriaceae bacterium]